MRILLDEIIGIIMNGEKYVSSIYPVSYPVQSFSVQP